MAVLLAFGMTALAVTGDDPPERASTPVGSAGGAAPAPAGARTTTPSTSPAVPQATVACSELDPKAWRPSPTSADLVAEVRAGTAPGPGVAAGPLGPAVMSSEYPTAGDFLVQSSVSDPAGRAQAMAAAGYAGGIENEYDTALPSSVQVLAFRDAAAAADYVTARLPDLCQLRGTDQLTPLGDDGFAFVDGMGAVHAEFLLGGSQVSLVICGCAPDAGIAEAQRWYQGWVDRYGA